MYNYKTSFSQHFMNLPSKFQLKIKIKKLRVKIMLPLIKAKRYTH